MKLKLTKTEPPRTSKAGTFPEDRSPALAPAAVAPAAVAPAAVAPAAVAPAAVAPAAARWATRSQLAELLNISISTLDRMRAAGEIRTVRMRRAVRFSSAEVERQLANRPQPQPR